jgi:hypothetical protein
MQSDKVRLGSFIPPGREDDCLPPEIWGIKGWGDSRNAYRLLDDCPNYCADQRGQVFRWRAQAGHRPGPIKARVQAAPHGWGRPHYLLSDGRQRRRFWQHRIIEAWSEPPKY